MSAGDAGSVMSAMIRAIMTAVFPLPAAADQNLFTAEQSTLERYKTLPGSRAEAVLLAQGSSFVHKHLPQMLIDAYCD